MSSRRAAHHFVRGAKRSREILGECWRKISAQSSTRARGNVVPLQTKRLAQRAGAGLPKPLSNVSARRLRQVSLPGVALLVYAIAWIALVAGFVTG